MTATTASREIDQGLLESWLVDAYEKIEAELEAQEPDQRPVPTLIQRYARHLQILGAVLLGFLVASGCIFACFILLNFIFHMQP